MGKKIKILRNRSALSFCFANCIAAHQIKALAKPNAQLFQISALDDRIFKESECSPHPQQPKLLFAFNFVL